MMLKFILLSFSFFFIFSISHSNVVHMEVFIKDFPGIIASRIMKFGNNIGYDLLHCARENQHPHAYLSLFFAIFLFLK